MIKINLFAIILIVYGVTISCSALHISKPGELSYFSINYKKLKLKKKKLKEYAIEVYEANDFSWNQYKTKFNKVYSEIEEPQKFL